MLHLLSSSMFSTGFTYFTVFSTNIKVIQRELIIFATSHYSVLYLSHFGQFFNLIYFSTTSKFFVNK